MKARRICMVDLPAGFLMFPRRTCQRARAQLSPRLFGMVSDLWRRGRANHSPNAVRCRAEDFDISEDRFAKDLQELKHHRFVCSVIRLRPGKTFDRVNADSANSKNERNSDGQHLPASAPGPCPG